MHNQGRRYRKASEHDAGGEGKDVGAVLPAAVKNVGEKGARIENLVAEEHRHEDGKHCHGPHALHYQGNLLLRVPLAPLERPAQPAACHRLGPQLPPVRHGGVKLAGAGASSAGVSSSAVFRAGRIAGGTRTGTRTGTRAIAAPSAYGTFSFRRVVKARVLALEHQYAKEQDLAQKGYPRRGQGQRPARGHEVAFRAGHVEVVVALLDRRRVIRLPVDGQIVAKTVLELAGGHATLGCGLAHEVAVGEVGKGPV